MVDDELISFLHSTKGVKDLVDKGMTQVPKFYIRPQELASCKASEKVPIIDLSRLHGPEHSHLIQEVAQACEEWGFFQVVNHGVPAVVMQEMIEVAHEFFNMPVEERMKLFSTNLWDTTRFGTSHNPKHESILEWKDYLRHPCLPLEKSMLSWPSSPSSYREVTATYCKQIKALSDKLLQILSESLGLDSGHLDKAFGTEKLQEMFLNYYPPCPNPEFTVGISPHSDAGGITLLLQNDVGGLEVLKNGSWNPIELVQGALVINIGDQLQILSNGRFKSVEHRAKVNREKTRISIPTFYQPSFGVEISPIPQLLNAKPAIYKSVRFEEYVKGFFMSRLDGKSYIENHQIK